MDRGRSPLGSSRKAHRKRGSAAEAGVVEDRVTDVAGGEGGAVGERGSGREVLAETEDEAMRAVVVGRTEEPGHDDLRGDGATDFGRGGAGQWKVEVVHDKGARGRGGDEARRKARSVGGGMTQGHEQFGVGDVVVGFKPLVDFGGEILRERDRGQAVEGAFPRAGDGAAGDDEPEGGVEAEVDAAQNGIGAREAGAGEQVSEGDVDAIGRGAVDGPRGAGEERKRGGRRQAFGVDGAVAGLGGAGPALLGFGRDDSDGVAVGEERGDEFVKERAGDAVVVGDEKIHGVDETTKSTKDTKKENRRFVRVFRMWERAGSRRAWRSRERAHSHRVYGIAPTQN